MILQLLIAHEIQDNEFITNVFFALNLFPLNQSQHVYSDRHDLIDSNVIPCFLFKSDFSVLCKVVWQHLPLNEDKTFLFGMVLHKT